MYPFKVEHLNVDELTTALIESRKQKSFQRTWDFFPHQLLTESCKIFEQFILLCIFRDDTGYNLGHIGQLKKDEPGQSFVRDTQLSLYSKLSTGENIESLSKELFDQCLSNSERSHFFWAYYVFSITHEKCSPRYCLNWLREASTGEHTYVHYDKEKMKSTVDFMTVHVKAKVGQDNSFMNRYDAALLSLNLECGIDAKRVEED